MNILCSSLPNDRDMIHALGSVAVPTILFTDCCFGSVDGKIVCIERKKIGDMAQCVNDGRFLHQMQTCKENGGDILCLILEGRYRRNPEDGWLEIPVWGINPHTMRRAEVWQPVKPAMQFSRFDQYLTELVRDADIIIKHAEDVRGTADVIRALYKNFQTLPDQHQSLKQFFKSPAPSVQLARPGLVRRVAAELSGLGWEWSAVVDKHFHSVREMVNADRSTWAGLEIRSSSGRKMRLGAKRAEKIVKSLGGSD